MARATTLPGQNSSWEVHVPTVLCLEDSTCALAETTSVLRESGYKVLVA